MAVKWDIFPYKDTDTAMSNVQDKSASRPDNRDVATLYCTHTILLTIYTNDVMDIKIKSQIQGLL